MEQLDRLQKKFNLIPLEGKEIQLFDSSGGCLDAQGKYVKDWWEIETIILERVQGKYFFLRSMATKFQHRHKLDSVLDITENTVTIAAE